MGVFAQKATSFSVKSEKIADYVINYYYKDLYA
jgi:hypothetical protein